MPTVVNASAGAILIASLTGLPVGGQAAEQPPLPDELAVTDSIVLTDEDELYLSPFVQYFKLPDQKRLMIGSEVAYGLTDRLQLAAEVPYVFVNPRDSASANGIGDVDLAMRYGVLDFRQQPFALNVGLALELPTGDRSRDLGEGRVSIEPFFTASQWFGRVNAQLNFAWHRAVSSGGSEPNNDYEYNLAVVYPIRRWFLILEGNGETNRERTRYYVTPAIV